MQNKNYYDFVNQYQMLQQQNQIQNRNPQDMNNYFDYMSMMMNNNNAQYNISSQQPPQTQIEPSIFPQTNSNKKNKKSHKKAQKKKSFNSNTEEVHFSRQIRCYQSQLILISQKSIFLRCSAALDGYAISVITSTMRQGINVIDVESQRVQRSYQR